MTGDPSERRDSNDNPDPRDRVEDARLELGLYALHGERVPEDLADRIIAASSPLRVPWPCVTLASRRVVIVTGVRLGSGRLNHRHLPKVRYNTLRHMVTYMIT